MATTRRGESVRRRREEKVAVEAKSTVRRKRTGEDEVEKVDVFETRTFDTDPAYVRLGLGVTRNMQNYESLRIDVSITMPCYPAEVDQTYEQLSEKAGEMLEKELDNYFDGE